MKFEYEKTTAKSIARRVREEEQRTSQRVTTVFLTPCEWNEFLISNYGCSPADERAFRLVRIALTEPPPAVLPSRGDFPTDIRTIEVRRGY